MEYLDYKKIFYFRVNSGAFKTEKGGFYKMSTPGCPDIVCVVRGQFVGLEIKDIKGSLNANQIEFKKKLEAAGGIYLIVKSLDDIKELSS